MARAYYSLVIDHPADTVWSVIRSFEHNAWAGVAGQTVVEDGRKGDQIGSVRRFSNGEKTIRQVLLAHSDIERSYSYAFCDQAPFPVQHYQATLRVTPVVETNRAFLEWWATFDCAPTDHERMINHFEALGFAVWLAQLRRFLRPATPTGPGAGAPPALSASSNPRSNDGGAPPVPTRRAITAMSRARKKAEAYPRSGSR